MLKLNCKVMFRFSYLLAAAMLLFSCNPVSQEKGAENEVVREKVNAYNDVAMDGFDMVAYFKQGKPVKGETEIEVDYKGKRWLFSSAENAEAFAQSPAAFEPQFNGWCAYAVSKGYAAEVDFLNGWVLLDGKLYLNWDAEIRDTFVDEQNKRIADADKNWSEVHEGIQDGSVELYSHAEEGVDIQHPQNP